MRCPRRPSARRLPRACCWTTRARAISSTASTRCGSATARSRTRAELIAAFNHETTRLIDRVVFDEPQSYLDLFRVDRDLPQRLCSPSTTACPARRGGAGWVSYGTSGRAGILSHGSVLAAFSKFTDTSPTQRGIFVQHAAALQRDLAAAGQRRRRSAARRRPAGSASTIATRRTAIDPELRELPQPDRSDRLRSRELRHRRAATGRTTTACRSARSADKASLPGYGTFSGPAELGAEAGRRRIARALRREAVLQLRGRPRARRSSSSSRSTRCCTAFAAGGLAFDRLLVAHVASAAFALRKEPVTP